MSWLFFAFIALFSTVTYSLISKKLLNSEAEGHPIAFASTLFINVTIMCALLYGLTAFSWADFQALRSPEVLVWLVIDIVSYTIAPFLYYQALNKLPLSEVTIFFSLSGLFALGIGVVFGFEQFLPIRLVGGVFILAAIILMNYKGSKWQLNKSSLMMLVASFMYGIAFTSDNQIVTHGYLNNIFFQMIVFGVPALLLLFVPGVLKDVPRLYKPKNYLKITLNGVFLFVSFLAIYHAYSLGGEASQVNLVIATEVVLTVVGAAIFLNERTQLWLKITAAVLACVGVYLLH